MLLRHSFSRLRLPVPLASLRICSSRSKRYTPPEPFYDRKKMIEICKPIIVPQRKPDWEECTSNLIEELTVHPYEKLLAKDIKEYWEKSKMILFYHVSPLGINEHRKVRNTFYKNDLFFHITSSTVIQTALESTKFSSIFPLFDSRNDNTAVVFSNEITVAKALKMDKKIYQVSLMAGVIEDRLYSKNQLQHVNDLYKRDGLQELSQLLSYVPSSIKGTINHHSQMLCHLLNQVSADQK